MLEAQLNIFDVIVIFVLGFSALVSFFRGFLREVFSLGAWLGAGIITLYTFPTVATFLGSQISNPMVANGFASMGTFAGSLIIISIFASIMLKYLKPGTEVGMVDNTLGLIFGVARGMLLVAIGFYVMSLFLRPSDYPDWVQHATTRPFVEKMAGLVAQITPNYLSEISPDPDDAALDTMLEDALGDAAQPHEDNGLPEVLPNSDSNSVIEEDAPFWPSMDELKQTIDESEPLDAR